jgi:hypothetical protein
MLWESGADADQDSKQIKSWRNLCSASGKISGNDQSRWRWSLAIEVKAGCARRRLSAIRTGMVSMDRNPNVPGKKHG